jgi:phytoene/squalene synthetase
LKSNYLYNNPVLLTYFKRELFILNCFAGLLRRDFRKYFTVAGTTYWLGASGLYPAAKPTYFFCRYVDDLADGDHNIPQNYQHFEQFIHQMKESVQNTEKEPVKNIELVLADAIRKLKKKSGEPALIRKELNHFLDSMLIDYNRRLKQTVLTQSEIDKLYNNSFSSVLQLTFLGTGTQLAREYIRLLGLIQGKLYALQDMREDLRAGIINIPAVVINAAGYSLAELRQKPAVIESSKAWQGWRQAELEQCTSYMHTLQTLEVNSKVRKIIGILTDPLDKYLQAELSSTSQLLLQQAGN